MRQWPERSRKRVRLEIIPMIDVMMFLLVFFVLISINVLPSLGLKIALPHSALPTRLEETKRVTITLAADGTLFLEARPITLAHLPDELEEIEEHSKIAVIIVGDEHTQLQSLVDLLDALKRANVPAASIITKPK
ncbi:MAG TPA: biopolymer transporter ExbD [Steroidobacteraceae bacterium]|nr:biopolymer transporter ExbD [Steroidobacteraceae bacterium]